MRKTVSLILTISFLITAITGLLMMFAHLRQVTPLHELMSLVLVISAIFHIVLNAKCIWCYIKENAVLTGILLLLAIAITTLLIVANPHQERGHGPQYQHGQQAVDRD